MGATTGWRCAIAFRGRWWMTRVCLAPGGFMGASGTAGLAGGGRRGRRARGGDSLPFVKAFFSGQGGDPPPRPPGIYRIPADWRDRDDCNRPGQSAHGSALRSHPCVALSSAHASSSLTGFRSLRPQASAARDHRPYLCVASRIEQQAVDQQLLEEHDRENALWTGGLHSGVCCGCRFAC